MSNQANGLYEFGSYRLDAPKRLLTRSGESVALAPKTFDLLLLLIRGQGRVLTKTELMTALWPDTFVEEASLSYQVATLRKALGSEGEDSIETVPKHGYRFAAAIATVPQEHEPGDVNSMATTAPSDRKSARMTQDVVEATAIRAARVRERLVIGTTSLLAIALAVAGAGWWRAAHPVDRPLTRFSVDLGQT